MTAHALELKHVSIDFSVGGGLFRAARTLRAVDDVSLAIEAGETLGLVGESGCGKSTVARIMLGLLRPTSGSVLLNGRPVNSIPRRERVRQIQPVFQDPYSSLNPARTVIELVEQPLRVHGQKSGSNRAALKMLDQVGFPKRLAGAYPGELSGGQRQRVAIARALVLRPAILICDEPTSALDVSVQAQVINLLLDLRKEFGLTMLFVSHNLAVVEHLASRVAVMYLGQVVELATARKVFEMPLHPYTKALFASTLSPIPGRGLPGAVLGSAAADPFSINAGCSLQPRCPVAQQSCRTDPPQLRSVAHAKVRCHFA